MHSKSRAAGGPGVDAKKTWVHRADLYLDFLKHSVSPKARSIPSDRVRGRLVRRISPFRENAPCHQAWGDAKTLAIGASSFTAS